MKRFSLLVLGVGFALVSSASGLESLATLTAAKTRCVSPENITGALGRAAMAVPSDPPQRNVNNASFAAGELGQGWKVNPYVYIGPGETFTMMDVEGPGTIQHMWMTLTGAWRKSILRIYWDGETEPSVEVPAADFFCQGWGEYAPVVSAPVCVNPGSAFNCYWRMPFRKHCRMTMTNVDLNQMTLYYFMDYELDEVRPDQAYFHAQFRHVASNETSDFVILDGVRGRGQYVGTYLAWGVHNDGWWGEGEVKFFIDDDEKFPTVCSTGLEDYFCGSYNFDRNGHYVVYTTPYAGLCQVSPPDQTYKTGQRFGLYRWHIADPVRFSSRLKVTAQDLGWKPDKRYLAQKSEIASTAFWYQTEPHEKFPPLPDWAKTERVVLDARLETVSQFASATERTLLISPVADKTEEDLFMSACRALGNPLVEGFAFPSYLEPSLKGRRSLFRRDNPGELLAPVKKRIALFRPREAFPYVRRFRASSGARSVVDFGAVGDGRANDTAAIQRAIDAVAASGGGTVEVPRGRYVTGSLYLKDGIDFYLAEGATLLASTNRADYNVWNVCPQNSTNAVEASWGAHLLLAIGKRRVVVRGPGRIDGNSSAFTLAPDGRVFKQHEIAWRVSQMLYFVDCEDVTLENLDLDFASYWSCFLHGCRRVTVRGLDIRTDRVRHTMSGDGLDIDCCEDVDVSECRIDTADDAIAIRANDARLGGSRPCRHIRVRDCRLSGAPDGIRLGGGCGLIEDVAVSNVVFRDCTWAVKFSPSWLDGAGTTIRNVRFDDLDVEAACLCEIRRTRTNELENVRFENVRAKTSYPAYVTGLDAAHPVRDIVFSNVRADQPLVRIDTEGVEVVGGAFPTADLTREAIDRNFLNLIYYENRAYWYGALP